MFVCAFRTVDLHLVGVTIDILATGLHVACVIDHIGSYVFCEGELISDERYWSISM
jgi:hypothetical protein